ncbi:hypothetical protein CTEN210_01862 [Chaetoceros tenuissimus]|uniref:Alpha-type protein kinase domain-containing protein n=1 Tax=Chaetoceros tenuissimus TaxID=426638 RepID=A0AAD3CGU4_9STRA|nr:hypothetical protein CTEN210_01862 [Chaetoceros tenuissimus]
MGMTASTNNDSSTGGDTDSTSINNGNINEQHTVTLESGRVDEGGRKRKRPIASISCSPSSLRQRLSNEHNDVSNPKKIQKVKKQVTFARKESEIRYYHDAYGHVNENLEIHKSSEKKSSCLTKEMTLLSTEHGKARRELRNISKYDLQSAIKYGVKSKARKVKGEQRWMFKYGNITFITDDTCSKECKLLDIDEEDMPAYTVVFLSDGKPINNKSDDCSRRSELMTKISWRLSNKITFFCMGIGAAGSEFAELDRIVTIAKEAGACKNSQFVHAGLNTVAMSNAFSSLATSTTATRTKMLSMDDTENSKPVKQFKMRPKGLCSHEVTSTRFTQQILRYQYDPSLEDPWREISFRNSKTTAIEIEDDPFGKGAERLAYRFYEVRQTSDGKWKRVGGLMVAKDSIKVQDEDKNVFHRTFCYVQMKASEFAAQFNKLVAKTPALQPTEEEVRRPPPIIFLKCHIYEYEDGDGDGARERMNLTKSFLLKLEM